MSFSARGPMPDPIPFLIVGDGPAQPTGLGRIGRDLALGLHAESEALGIDLVYLGLHHMGERFPFHCVRIQDIENYGHHDVWETWRRIWGERPGIIFAIFDPGRLWGFWERAPLGSELWAYMAVDACTPADSHSTFIQHVLKQVHRPLAYGRWSSRLTRQVLQRPAPWLPHGLDLRQWKPIHEGERFLIGAVGTNQPRKDWNLVFETFALLHEADPSLFFWAHTDTTVRHWSLPELQALYKLDDPELLMITEAPIGDDELQGLYSQCLATIGPGRGEGFGYPGVESLACGAPHIAVNYAGGPELQPMSRWRVPYESWTVEGAHCLVRPVLEAGLFAERVLEAVAWQREEPRVVAAYCAGAVAHLDWQSLWPRWRSWFKKGIEGWHQHQADRAEAAKEVKIEAQASS
jgi:glycosyltransferase involved in cell wall biosynthesis